jgi:hypothetical protein
MARGGREGASANAVRASCYGGNALCHVAQGSVKRASVYSRKVIRNVLQLSKTYSRKGTAIPATSRLLHLLDSRLTDGGEVVSPLPSG